MAKWYDEMGNDWETSRTLNSTRGIWQERVDLFETPGRKVFDLGPVTHVFVTPLEEDEINSKEKTTMNDAAALRSEAAKLLTMAHRIEKLSVVDNFPEGTLLRWIRVINDVSYIYAAVKTNKSLANVDFSQKLWYVTGEKSSRGPVDMNTLRDLWIAWDVKEIDVFTNEPSLVLGREDDTKSIGTSEVIEASGETTNTNS